ncbi:Pyruvate/2-oxoglutarate dehydrogenase complex, dihydrolipoamide dehydrogenase (E3) component [Abditibacterium utsteinense]|uniref:Pyruvate/2-oxoglutarate dehydrogenase complex, dihydrolipoamide dehydrogenase (E3) component n=2 Tax=Abditibacterium utsteinense TaxID=1960156 RepID=A0A2S8SW89_9BACT|nr:Pyruvate/2-oxoglutarate dehydrogenase complex, dihydrolipoamide dehydrogenase (E3) component [Abditibacterium utsteinense]
MKAHFSGAFPFDAIIIGAGQGAALARMLGEAGQRVALIERETVGGSCVNRGCTPTKAHIAAAKRAHDARSAHHLGVEIPTVRVDLRAVAARSQSIVEEFRDEIRGKLGKLDTLELVFGEASFVDAQVIEVRAKNGETQRFQSQKIIVATGTRAQIPAIAGLDEIEWLDHRSILQLEEIPEKLLILGGGYIACEFAQMFARFGSKVCIAQSAAQLLTREDADIAGEIAALLRAENIEIRFDCQVKSVEKTARGLVCHLECGDSILATHLLLATGQTPNTEALHLEAAGIECDKKGFIPTDDKLGAAPGIWALGDVKGGPAFTHIAYDDARILADILLGKPARSICQRPVPYCVFTDPQLGRIGLTEREAGERGLEIRVAKLPCSETARGIESGEAGGFLKAIIEKSSGQILGGAFLCRDGGEIIAVLQMAMQAGLPYTALRDGIFAHPTFAESLNNLFLAMERAEKSEACPGCLK